MSKNVARVPARPGPSSNALAGEDFLARMAAAPIDRENQGVLSAGRNLPVSYRELSSTPCTWRFLDPPVPSSPSLPRSLAPLLTACSFPPAENAAFRNPSNRLALQVSPVAGGLAASGYATEELSDDLVSRQPGLILFVRHVGQHVGFRASFPTPMGHRCDGLFFGMREVDLGFEAAGEEDLA